MDIRNFFSSNKPEKRQQELAAAAAATEAKKAKEQAKKEKSTKKVSPAIAKSASKKQPAAARNKRKAKTQDYYEVDSDSDLESKASKKKTKSKVADSDSDFLPDDDSNLIVKRKSSKSRRSRKLFSESESDDEKDDSFENKPQYKPNKKEVISPKESSRKTSIEKKTDATPRKKLKVEQASTTPLKSKSGNTLLEEQQPEIQLSTGIVMPKLAPVCRQPVSPKSQMWVDKYKPTLLKQVVGQQGAKSAASKLVKWLTNWYRNKNVKMWSGPANRAPEDGAGWKAALLSGPPGIGKTTMAQLAAKECGFEYVELNASDTRNKKHLEQTVRSLLQNKSLTTMNSSRSTTTKHLLIMDEVDGMGGNADRGGIAEIIQLIKTTKIPIICICNDRSDPKMRSLVNYCFDLRVFRPRIEQIKAAMMSICFKENVKIDPNTLSQVIESSNQDIRQVIHYLSLFTSQDSALNETDSQEPMKDVKLGPFDALKKMFTEGAEYEAMSFHDKTDLFFADYSLMPLFAFENYIQVRPKGKNTEADKLEAAAKSISAMSFGDLIESNIRQLQNWSLLPMQAAFATVMPGYYMNGHLGGIIRFPAILGKISSINKKDRLLQELKQHMNLQVSGSKTSLNLDYLKPLRDKLLRPLIEADEKTAVEQTMALLESYNLRKDDMETILELTLWKGEKNPYTDVSTKTKSALTRTYNKKGEFLPYESGEMFKKVAKGKKAAADKTAAGRKKKADDDDETEEANADDDELILPDF